MSAAIGDAPVERGGDAPVERGGDAPVERGGADVPVERGGDAPVERGGDAPVERGGGDAPVERGGDAPGAAEASARKRPLFVREDPPPPEPGPHAYTKEETDRWVHVVMHWGEFTSTRKGMDELRRMTAKGIPDSLRGVAWQKMTDSRELVLSNPGVLEEFCRLSSAYETEIARDVGRTFPDLEMFRDPQGEGQASLKRILKAHSVFNREIGYCQGMNFLAALPMLVMSEEEAFWFLVQLLKKYGLIGMYRENMDMLKRMMHQLDGLLDELLPDLHAHMKRNMIQTSLICTEWFLTLFIYNFPHATTFRIWDMFLLDGERFLFKVALAMLRMYNDVLLCMAHDDIVMLVKSLPAKFADPERLVEAALEFDIDPRLLERYKRQYIRMTRSPGDDDDDDDDDDERRRWLERAREDLVQLDIFGF